MVGAAPNKIESCCLNQELGYSICARPDPSIGDSIFPRFAVRRVDEFLIFGGISLGSLGEAASSVALCIIMSLFLIDEQYLIIIIGKGGARTLTGYLSYTLIGKTR